LEGFVKENDENESMIDQEKINRLKNGREY
jgi:hypothetical protein